MDVIKILEYALEREIEGKRFFMDNADRLQNAAARGAFLAIAGEEQKHIDYITAQLTAQKSGSTVQPVDLPAPGILDKRAETEAIDQKVAESMVADLPVLRMAYLIERDFAEFYTMTAAKTDGDAHKVLEMLAHWESGHERLFKHMHDKAFEAYSGMPWGG